MSVEAVGWAFSRRRLDPIDKLVLIGLADVPTGDPPWDLTVAWDDLCAFCGLSEEEAADAVKNLVRGGLVRVRGGARRGPSPFLDYRLEGPSCT